MVKRQAAPPTDLVLADIPERQRLRALQRELSRLRDEIAAVDLEIETLRDHLGTFEALYHARLRPEHDRVRRTQNMVGHLERWVELLALRPEPQTRKRAWRVESRRERELGTEVRAAAAAAARDVDASVVEATAQWEPEPAVLDRREQLKAAYRELARRFHPDLARTEAERLTNSAMMTRINALYRAGDLERLLALREQARGGDIDAPELSVEEQLVLLEDRLRWFDAVLKNLHEERAALESSATCELWRNVEQARLNDRDLFAELKESLQERIDRLYDDVQLAVHSLESAVNRYNRDNTAVGRGKDVGLKKNEQGNDALETYFDPYADKNLVRLGLEQLGSKTVSPAVRKEAAHLEVLASQDPALLRLILFAHVAELSPFPLTGLESYDDLELRFDHLSASDTPPARLEATLVAADTILEYGVRRATAKLAHVGLRFRNPHVREAVPLAAQSLVVRREFKRVLGVLGEHTACSKCKAQIFAVPLYRTRGLDDLRASVCPLCGETLRSYWMPKGKDVQAVLNAAFLDFEIITEWSFTLARASIAMQLVPQQVETLSVGDLKTRLVADAFSRYDLEVERQHVQLLQNRLPVDDDTPLDEIETTRFALRFTEDAPVSESDALEMVRHRIRNKFSDR